MTRSKSLNLDQMHSFDLIVIGSGPGGQKAALQAAKSGKKAAIVEAHPRLGGSCVHFGTLPSKSFRESVYRWSMSSRGTLGQELGDMPTDPSERRELPDMKRLLRRYKRVVETESRVVRDQLERNRVQTFFGRARLTSANDVEVIREREEPLRLRADVVILATGAHPVSPAYAKFDGERILSSDTILDLKATPSSMIVLGAGVIGVEYASMFQMAGTKVHMVDQRDQILPFVDREIVGRMVDRFRHHGMDLILGTTAQKVERKKKGLVVTLADGRILEAEVLLVAQGRQGNTEGMGLEALGVKVNERGLIEVNSSFQTAVPNIYAVGDVIGLPALASTSMEQGRAACCHAFQIKSDTALDMPELYPFGIYTIPEISMVGMNEEQVIGAGHNYVVGKAYYGELARGLITGDRWGLLKVIVERKTFKLLGVHILGDNAADLIHIGQAVMTLGGDARYFIRSVFNYPTLAEAYKTAAFAAINEILGIPHSHK